MTPPQPPPVFELTRPALVWGATGALLAGIGWFKGINLMLLIGYFLLGLMLVNAVVGRVMVLRVTARRRSVAVVFAGERLAHVVEASTIGLRPAMVLLTETAGTQSARWLFTPLRPGSDAVLRTDFVFPSRQVCTLPPIVAESAYPFGLVRWTADVSLPGEIRVLPAVGRVGVEDLRRFVARAAGGEGRSRRPARRPAAGSGDVRGVRPYRPGDSPRDIHWRTTARRGQLVVREYDQTDPLDLVILIDPWLPAGADAVTRERLEWALGLAVSVGWAWAVSDEPGELTLVIPGPTPYVRTGRATPTFVRDAFAPIAGITGMQDVPTLPAAAVRPSATRTARLVVSSRPDSSVLAGLRGAGFAAAGVDATSPPRWYLPAGPAIG
ncbi:MAG: DUF58 domain-containing protein [Fimbriiglobus sp.]